MFIVLLQGVQHDQKLRGSLLGIVCCLVVEFGNFNQKEYLLIETGFPSQQITVTFHLKSFYWLVQSHHCVTDIRISITLFTII